MSISEAKQSILIVEDEFAQLNALYDKLTREDFTVLEAKNGKEGLEIALRDHPDLILLDIVMPVMDGLTMVKKLRQANEWGKKVPIILLTNLSSDDKITTQFAPNEFADYLVKTDWKIDDVVEKIRERLSLVV